MDKLAIDGGRPVRPAMLPYGRQAIDESDVRAVVDVLRSDWLTTGPNVVAFEQEFSRVTGAAHAVAFSSGTAALHAAAHVAGIGAGDEAIVPAITFVATANCVRYQGGSVSFADVRRDTLNIDPAGLASKVTPKTRAIIAVDYAGQPADLDELRALTRDRGLVLIEDASHALGALHRGRPVGSIADLTTFSLHPVKHITTGEGGMVTTQSEDLAAKLRLFRNHGITTDHRQRETSGSFYYEMVELGFNYRLTDIQAALGTSQLQRLPGWLERRAAIARAYERAFAAVDEVERPATLADRVHAWHLYTIRLNLDRLRVGRNEVYRALRAENIGVNVHYIPVPWHPYYAALGFERGAWPVAEHEYERLLSIPMWPGMSDHDVEDVVAAVRKVVSHFRR